MIDLKKKCEFSIELFPPKTEDDLKVIADKLPDFVKLKPDYISVTYGAGGGTREGSVSLIGEIIKLHHINAVAHLTCVNATKESIKEQLTLLKKSGVKNILALRGDISSEQHKIFDFRYATDLIKYINFLGGFDVWGACYPEGHFESDNFRKDIEVMKLKNTLGVKKFISQLFFDNAEFYKMQEYSGMAGIDAKLIAGIMPITNGNQIARVIKLSGAKIPARLSKILSRFEGNPEALKQAGLNFALEQITDLIASGVDGIHLYSMNNPETAENIRTNISAVLNEVNSKL